MDFRGRDLEDHTCYLWSISNKTNLCAGLDYAAGLDSLAQQTPNITQGINNITYAGEGLELGLESRLGLGLGLGLG